MRRFSAAAPAVIPKPDHTPGSGRGPPVLLLDTWWVPKQVAHMHWLDRVDVQTILEVHRVVSAVVEIGGAVGWLQTPTRAGIGQWLGGWHAAATTGRAGLLCVGSATRYT